MRNSSAILNTIWKHRSFYSFSSFIFSSVFIFFNSSNVLAASGDFATPDTATPNCSAAQNNSWPVPILAGNQTAVGCNAQTLFSQSVAIGASANASGEFSTAIGAEAATGFNGAYQNGEGATAVGGRAKAATYGTSLGYGANAQYFGTAIGYNSSASVAGATAVGTEASAANYSSAYGWQAQASSFNSTAIGVNSTASGERSTAIGARSDTANFAYSTAVGYGATNTAANQMMLGTASTTYSAPGITSSASKAAQSGPTQFVSTDANGNLASSGFGPQDIANLQNGQAILGQTVYSQGVRINSIQKEARQGVAMAAAMSQAPMPSAPGKTSWKLNNAIYKNAAATSLSIAHRLPTKVPVAVTAGVAIGLRNSAIVTGGLQGEF